MILQCEGCCTRTFSGILEHWYSVWQSWKIYQPPCKPTYHKSSWLIYIITYTFSTVHIWPLILITASQAWSPSSTPHPPEKHGESVLFQPVLKAYPTWHSWLITAHISLGHLECHWKTFNRQMDRTWQVIRRFKSTTLCTNSVTSYTTNGVDQ